MKRWSIKTEDESREGQLDKQLVLDGFDGAGIWCPVDASRAPPSARCQVSHAHLFACGNHMEAPTVLCRVLKSDLFHQLTTTIFLVLPRASFLLLYKKSGVTVWSQVSGLGQRTRWMDKGGCLILISVESTEAFWIHDNSLLQFNVTESLYV